MVDWLTECRYENGMDIAECGDKNGMDIIRLTVQKTLYNIPLQNVLTAKLLTWNDPAYAYHSTYTLVLSPCKRFNPEVVC